MKKALVVPILLVAVLAALWMVVMDGDAPGDLTSDTQDPAVSDQYVTGPRGIPATPDAGLADADRMEAAGDAPEDGPETTTFANRVTGRVLFESGKPAVHALVWVVLGPDRNASTESGKNGIYSLRLPPGEHTVLARHAGTGTARATVMIDADVAQDNGPTLRLDEGGVILGQVCENDGTPLPGYRVRCHAETGEVVEFFTNEGTHIRVGSDDVLTEKDGSFRLKGLERGVPHIVELELFPRNHLAISPERFEGVVPGGRQLIFEVRPLRSIEGYVRDAVSGKPLEHFRIGGLQVDDERGHFEVAMRDRTPPLFEALGYQLQERLDLLPREGESIRGLVIDMQPDPDTGSARLAVKNELGKPIRDFRTVIDPWSSRSWRRSFDETDDPPIVEGLSVGQQNWRIYADGHTIGEVRFEVEQGKEALVAVVLKRAAPARLRIFDAAGSLFSGDIAVSTETGEGPRWSFHLARRQGTLLSTTSHEAFPGNSPSRVSLTEADGEIRELAAGQYLLLVYYDFEPKRVPFEIFPESPIDLIVRP